MSTFTPESPYLKALADSHGRTWQFAYWGSGYVYIREMIDSPDIDDLIIPVGENATRDDWPYLIDLNYYSDVTRETITRVWLTKHAVEWAADRSNENREDTP